MKEMVRKVLRKIKKWFKPIFTILILCIWTPFVFWYVYNNRIPKVDNKLTNEKIDRLEKELNSTKKELELAKKIKNQIDILEKNNDFYKINKSSRDRLKDCDPRLQIIIYTIAERYEILVDYGFISESDQKEMFSKGRLEIEYIKEHNEKPAKAIIISPGDCYTQKFISDRFEIVAKNLNIPIDKIKICHFKLRDT